MPPNFSTLTMPILPSGHSLRSFPAAYLTQERAQVLAYRCAVSPDHTIGIDRVRTEDRRVNAFGAALRLGDDPWRPVLLAFLGSGNTAGAGLHLQGARILRALCSDLGIPHLR